MKKTNRKSSKKTSKKYGGGATVMPSKYYNSTASEPSANAGHDLLKAIPPVNIRPRIGGNRKINRKFTRKRGGFMPSIMDGFVAAASKYIVPITLFAGYKLMTRKNKKDSKHRK